jgi:hypothetical protein
MHACTPGAAAKVNAHILPLAVLLRCNTMMKRYEGMLTKGCHTACVVLHTVSWKSPTDNRPAYNQATLLIASMLTKGCHTASPLGHSPCSSTAAAR